MCFTTFHTTCSCQRADVLDQRSLTGCPNLAVHNSVQARLRSPHLIRKTTGSSTLTCHKPLRANTKRGARSENLAYIVNRVSCFVFRQQQLLHQASRQSLRSSSAGICDVWLAIRSSQSERSMVDLRGFEPLTLGLQSRCSTTELQAPPSPRLRRASPQKPG